MFSQLIKELQQIADPERAKNLSWFFKTGKGEYGEGDQFIGISVPLLRSISKKYQALELKDLQKLLNSKFHEYRLSALMILRMKYIKASHFALRATRDKSEDKQKK